jgi:hypothetical protein
MYSVNYPARQAAERKIPIAAAVTIGAYAAPIQESRAIIALYASCAPGGIRTPDAKFRRLALYPLSYGSDLRFNLSRESGEWQGAPRAKTR